MAKVDIPTSLTDQIREGQVILFLGAGASYGALHPKKNKIPMAPELAKLLANKFLSSEYESYPLAAIAELAISERNLNEVQDYLAELLYPFQPNHFHKLIPQFVWKAVATTNYDLIIERAYEEKNRLQNLVPFIKNGERVENKLSQPNDLIYLKLHGSITVVNDINLPLILTVEQYITHRQNRSRLFDRLKDLAFEYPVLFVGYGLVDQNIRSIMMELGELGEAKPRSYLIDPFIKPEQITFWGNKKISAIPITFEDFLKEVNATIPTQFRGLATQTADLPPIQRRFKNIEIIPSESLRNFLSRDVDYLHIAFKTESVDPQIFYKGYFEGWSAIEMELDAKRDMSDSILSEVFLVEEDEKLEKQELIVLKGHAGSGKSVMLKRIAWYAATVWDKLCLFLKPSAKPAYEPISELFSLCKERIFLFIDSATSNIELIEHILSRAKIDKLPLTVVTAARQNEWNIFGERLESYETNEYRIKYLRPHEIERLIELLEKHKCLGSLEGKSLEDQKQALSEKAGRQLLVALHEATLGKPFQDIILDEYRNIPSPQAQQLYLTVSILHRLSVVTRAGVISRLHNISFEYFKEKLFQPLEHVVFAQKHPILNDYQYVTRHPNIAEMVFEQVLVRPADRFNEYSRMLSTLDVDFNSDRTAFEGMTKARDLRKLFASPEMIRDLYEIAQRRSPNDPFLMQQMAIFEISIDDGDLDRATLLLNRAHKLASYNKSILHSLSELALRKAEKSENRLEKIKYREESRKLAEQMNSGHSKTAHPIHTILKGLLSELEEILNAGNNTIRLQQLTQEISNRLNEGLQEFPDESFLLDADSRFNELLNSHQDAIDSLKKAFKSNKKSSYIALRFANMLQQSGDKPESIRVLKEAIEINPNDKDLNFKLAMILLEENEFQPKTEIKHYLRNSFTKGDTRFFAQFWYARYLNLEGSLPESMEIFNDLKSANIDARTKRVPRGLSSRDGKPVIYYGTVIKVEASSALLSRDTFNDKVHVYRYNDETLKEGMDWNSLRSNKRVSFEIAFNFYGTIALQISEENRH